MGLISSLLETRAVSNSPFDPIWASVSFGATKAGVSVTPSGSLNVSAVLACVRVLSETIASLPWHVYKKLPNGGKEVAKEFSLYKVIHDKPYPGLTSFELREFIIASLCLRGNAYVFKKINRMGQIGQLVPLDPARVQPEIRPDGRLQYRYTYNDGTNDIFSDKVIWHTKFLSTDGKIGLSPITTAREAIGLSLATENYGARFFSNNAKPGGVLTTPGQLTPAARDNLKKSWQEAHAGGANAHKTAVLEEGIKWDAIGLTNEDSQFLETRRFQIEEIARIFRVPTILIGHPDKSSTYASAEQFMLSFVIHTIRPWLVRIEQSANLALIDEDDQDTYFTEFNVDGLLRGDIKSRYDAYAIARQNKWLNANEIREKENLNPIDGGEVYENPNISINPGGDIKNANTDTQRK